MNEIEERIKELKAIKKELKEGAQTPAILVSSDVITGEEGDYDVDRVRDILEKLSKDQEMMYGRFVGSVGGSKKLIQCPNCEKNMVVAGAKTPRKPRSGTPSAKQTDWMDFVKAVGKLPKYQDKSRKEHMKIASKLRKEGITIADLKKLRKSSGKASGKAVPPAAKKSGKNDLPADKKVVAPSA